jgi:pimeloyl-ACP methyl ester carboxylesterase
MLYPALCIPDDARAGSMRAASFDPDNIPEEFDCGPMRLGRCYPEAVNQMDAVSEIKKYEGPVLLIHGTADEIVSIEYSKAAHQALKDSELVIIEGGAHGFAPEHDVTAIDAIRSFVR